MYNTTTLAGGMQFETVPVAVVAVNERNLTYLCGPGDCACETDMTIWPGGPASCSLHGSVFVTYMYSYAWTVHKMYMTYRYIHVHVHFHVHVYTPSHSSIQVADDLALVRNTSCVVDDF